MLRAINQLKKRDDIVITKPDKGSSVVVMDKSDYVRLLKESSILHGEHIFSPESRACLRKTVSDIASKEQFCTALFCCEPYVFLVGVRGGKLFLIDTHPVNQDLGGNGHGGLVKLYHNCSPKACEALCGWLWERLRTGGGLTEKAGHSFLLMSPETR